MAKRKPQPTAPPPAAPQSKTLREQLAEWTDKVIAAQAGRLPAARIDALRRQAAALDATAPPVPAKLPVNGTVVVRTSEALDAVAAALDGADVVALDLETSSLDHRNGEVVGVGVATAEGAWYVPVAHRIGATGLLLPDQPPLTVVADRLGFHRRRFVAHNGKFEMHWLRQHGGVVVQIVWDTELAARLMRPDLPADLKRLAARELDVPDWGLPKAELKRIQYLPVEVVAPYCGKDCAYTLRLMEKQKQCLS